MTLSASVRFRLLSLLPFAFWLGQAVHYWRHDGLPHLLWMCNIGNLLLAIGLFFQINWLSRLAAIWLIPGIVIWLQYIIAWQNFVISSFFVHIGGFVVSLYVLHKLGSSHQMALHAILWYLILQLFCRLFTDPQMNINVAHSVYGDLNKTFDSYWKFWLAATALVVFGMFMIQLVLLRIFPSRDERKDEIEDALTVQ
jgi:hypothetical protein